ncbi:alkaline phosphatase D family protein [Amycolatopsis sacchari]|uniref:alkaline phosphatase D family protein n=1 Tax=Amycolatopsis sacchari TaxID=115433 RepID=UPI003D75E71F
MDVARPGAAQPRRLRRDAGRHYDVDWELANDEAFSSVVQRGTVTTSRAQAHSVHVEPGGLDPAREYFYRFRSGGYVSPLGRTRTAPGAGAAVNQLKYCFTSCQHWEEGYYHAYRGVLADDPDLVLFLGDYICEKPSGKAASGKARGLAVPDDTTTLALYRARHGQHKTDVDLQAAHAMAPWIRQAQRQQPAVPAVPVGRRTITGSAQEQWLLNALTTHPATWDFLGQQVFFAQRDGDGDRNTCESPDSWNGYAASRDRITKGWVDRGVPVTSYGDNNPPSSAWFAHNPHVKYCQDKRGYVRVTATSAQLRADFRVVSNALEPDPAKVTISTDKAFVVQAGRKGLQAA